MRRRIGLSQRICLAPGSGEKRDCLARDWTVFLKTIGVGWVALPNCPESALELASELDLSGVVLTGGDDIGVFPERDATEAALMDWCRAGSRPVLGVCRGFQVMHWRHGGTLIRVDREIHVARRHVVDFAGGGEREVNSYHQFSPDFSRLPGGYPLRELARNRSDGAIEAAAGEGGWLGLMWHPEREAEPDPADIKLFLEHFKL